MFVKAFKNSIQQSQEETCKWIPCSERLPENRHYCYDASIVTLEDGDVCIGVYRHDSKSWYTRRIEGETWYTDKRQVVAWMPLPEPYKEN